MTFSRNILDTYNSSLEQERESGELWYRQANSLATLLGSVSKLSVRNSSAVIAALSPLNKWEDNVSDAFSLARDFNCPVRTSNTNKAKAISILLGLDPDKILSGRKVRSFWQAICDPYNIEMKFEVPVDRHLYRAAVGFYVNPHLAMPNSKEEYDFIVESYKDASNDLRIPITFLAATVWIVMRRNGKGRGIIF